MKTYNQELLQHGIIKYSRKPKYRLNILLLLSIVFLLFLIWRYDIDETRPDIIHTTPSITATPTLTPTPTEIVNIQGQASFYSEDGCLGCDDNLIMANGEKLDDSKFTVALTPDTVRKYKLLNDVVKIVNSHTGHSIYAKVTDTGGFAKYNRVADLSVATKDALGCNSLCQVRIYW